MCDYKETRNCENCEFSYFSNEYKKGVFEGLCRNNNILPKGPYQEFPRIRRIGTCGFWRPKNKDNV